LRNARIQTDKIWQRDRKTRFSEFRDENRTEVSCAHALSGVRVVNADEHLLIFERNAKISSKAKEASGKKEMERVAWGITGSGDKIKETVEVMERLREKYEGKVEISVYLSKAGEKVARYYKLYERLREKFRSVHVEIDANSPFLAGKLQTGKFVFLLVAPATANTVAKIAVGIADTLITNATLMALKAFVPVYIMPSDYKEGIITTVRPDGKPLKIRVRREDVENVRKIAKMDGITVIEMPEDIPRVFEKHFG